MAYLTPAQQRVLALRRLNYPTLAVDYTKRDTSHYRTFKRPGTRKPARAKHTSRALDELLTVLFIFTVGLALLYL